MGLTNPKKIFHLAIKEDWLAALSSGQYSMSTRGKTLEEVGFIHCSNKEQLPEVAAFVYEDFTGELLLLELDLETLEQANLKVLFEDGGNGQLYPHIYNPLPVELVSSTKPAIMNNGQLRVL